LQWRLGLLSHTDLAAARRGQYFMLMARLPLLLIG
jgi:hypothetical protein